MERKHFKLEYMRGMFSILFIVCLLTFLYCRFEHLLINSLLSVTFLSSQDEDVLNKESFEEKISTRVFRSAKMKSSMKKVWLMISELHRA